MALRGGIGEARRKRRRAGAFRVAVCIDTRDAPGRERLVGAYRYALERGWYLFLVRGDDAAACHQMAGLHVDGAILYDREPGLHRALRRLGAVTVEASARNLDLDNAAVFADDQKIARMAADHLIASGFEHFAYCGMAHSHQSLTRGEHFCDLITRRGFSATAFSGVWPDGEIALPPLVRWLRGIPRPAGILASDDRVAERVLAACRWLGLKVPDEIGVLGTSNDELMCELTHPRLSSVALPTSELGRRAAELLERILIGRPPRRPFLTLAPLEVIARASTDRTSAKDPKIAAAIEFIRANARRPIGTDQLADSVGIPRRTLERRFAKDTGQTIHQFLVEIRLRHAKQFLRHSDAPLNEVARYCGYLATSAFTRMFSASAGCHPETYRRQYRGR
ncbi:MAG: substrate-binding domain-containing protein [Verrucomicrobiae bacterium]|nr:substrate-binding domain-containing protein [Verrucomicrobiae bacterium]